MARAVRFTKPERETIRELCRTVHLSDWSTKVVSAAQSILAKLEESEHPKEKSSGLTVNQAVTAFRSALDRRLVVPPNGAGLEYIRMQQRLESLALTYDQCVTAAMQAGREWPKGYIKAQSILNNAEKLLHGAESEPLPMEGRSDYDTGRDTMDDL